jgi:hypothetical protein
MNFFSPRFVSCLAAAVLAVVILSPIAVRADSCLRGSICTVTLDNFSYTVVGPCDYSGASTISNCRVIARVSITSAEEAKLAVLGLAVLQWILIVSVHFLPLPIKNPIIRTLVQVAYGGSVGALFVIEIWLYRSMLGIKGNIYRQDQFLEPMIRVEGVVSLCVLFIPFVVRWWRKKSGAKV